MFHGRLTQGNMNLNLESQNSRQRIESKRKKNGNTFVYWWIIAPSPQGGDEKLVSQVSPVLHYNLGLFWKEERFPKLEQCESDPCSGEAWGHLHALIHVLSLPKDLAPKYFRQTNLFRLLWLQNHSCTKTSWTILDSWVFTFFVNGLRAASVSFIPWKLTEHILCTSP